MMAATLPSTAAIMQTAVLTDKDGNKGQRQARAEL